MKSVAIIPARMAATRLPDKPMREICGTPMIGHVYYRATLSKEFDDVYVATCDKEIFDYIESVGGKAVMTHNEHLNCIDRAVEAIQKIEEQTGEVFDIVGMLQGDEPMNDPDSYTEAVKYLKDNPEEKVVNIMVAVQDQEEFVDQSVVKVVCDSRSKALYMSREAIPTLKNGKDTDWTKQTGMIFFRKDYLLEFGDMPRGRLELVEKIDMLRVLEYGDSIYMIKAKGLSPSVDTPQDLETVESLMQKDPLFADYKEKLK